MPTRPLYHFIRRWMPIIVLLGGLLPVIAADQPPQAASAAPAGLGSADWQAIQAQLAPVQQAYLKASHPGGDDFFGSSVAIDGDTVVVGAYFEDSSSSGINSTPNEAALDAGAAYVFVRSGTTWSQQAYLKASNPGADDRFGTSVAVSGDTLVVGAPYEDSGSSGVNSPPNEVAERAGAAYVFRRTNGVWTEQAFLKASNPGTYDFFGSSVAIDGDTVVIGAWGEDSSSNGVNPTPNEGSPGTGAAYIFESANGTWSQQAFLKASNPGTGDYFGFSVAVSADSVVVGALEEDSGSSGVNSTPNEDAENAGAAYVFVRSGSLWTEQAYLKASNPEVNDLFGWSVAVSGVTIGIGAPNEDSSTPGINPTPNEAGFNAGAAYVFVHSGTTWAQEAYLKASNPGELDYFGTRVAVRGMTVVVGPAWEDSSTSGVNAPPNEDASGAGAAYVFVWSGTTWSQQAYLKASNPGAGDAFGWSVAMSDTKIVVSAPNEASSSSGVNSTPNEDASGAGAAYVFAVPAPRLYLPLLTR